MTGIQNRDFDKLSSNYDAPHAVKRAQAVAKAIRRQVPLDLKMDIMELGAGTGLVSLALWPFVHSIKAVDSSHGMLSELRRKVKDLGISNVTTLCCDIESDPLPEGKWDVIFSVMTLHHVADVERLLRTLQGILKPDGILAVADLDQEDGDFHPDTTGVHHFGFRRAEIKRLFRESGFCDVSVITAHKMSKQVSSGETRQFKVFLATGTREPDRPKWGDRYW